MSTQPRYPAVPGPTLQDAPALAALHAALAARFGEGLQAVILYGSCLRGGDLMDGLVDLYVLVDPTPRAEPRRALRLAGRVLPPNVYYLEAPLGQATVRCKYAVLSLRQFERGTGPAWFQSYLWGRFAQPVRVIWADSPATQTRIEAAFFRAAETLLRRALPALPEAGPVEALWHGALALSYGTELRAERKGRAAELAGHGRDFYTEMTRAVLPRLGGWLSLNDAGGTPCYHAHVPRAARRLAPLLWGLRRVQGKTLSMARLIKGLFTFEGGLDYLAWKLSRHSGQVVEIPDKVRRHPLIHIWGLCWTLYRRGVFH